MTENQRIKNLRKETNLSQKELAEAMGLDQSAISAIESGKNKATKNFKILLSHILNTNIEYIETGEGEKQREIVKFIEPAEADQIQVYKELVVQLKERLKEKDDYILLLKQQLATKSTENSPDISNRAVPGQLVTKTKK